MKKKIIQLLFLGFSLFLFPSVLKASLTYPITGDWVANVTEFGNTCTIYFSVQNDGTYHSTFDCGNSINTSDGTWQYNNGVLQQTVNANGRRIRGKIEWLNKDLFVITIIDNGNPSYTGLKRSYARGKKYQPASSGSLDDFVMKKCPGCHGVGQTFCLGCSDYSYMITCTVCGGLGEVYLNAKTGERYIPKEYKNIYDNWEKTVCRCPFNPDLVWYHNQWTKISNLPKDVKIIGQ